MPPRPANKIAQKLVAHLKALEWTRAKVERLFDPERRLVRRDVERVYEGLYLDAFTSFERSIEELFVALLTNRVAQTGVVTRVNFRSSKVARDVILGGNKKYVDWFPYDRTEERAKAFFRSGEPFTRLSNNDKKMIEELVIIRNAIAHRSRHSINRFEQKLIVGKGLPLPPRERTPAGFLRSKIDPSTTRFQDYLAVIADIMRKLCR